MSDLISRQLAIDAFERFIHELGIEDEPYNYGEMALSAQNVPSAIEDIKKERYNQGFVDGYKNSYDRGHAVIENIKAEIDDLDVSDLGKMGIITAILEIIDKHIGKAEIELIVTDREVKDECERVS